MSTNDTIIKDKPLENVFFYHVERMMRKVKTYTLDEFKANQFPVTKDQWVILKRISEINGSTQKEIANSTFKDPAALTRILDLLEKKGLINRQSSSEDRRVFEIHLTVEGNRLVNRMIPVVQEIRSKALAGLGDEEKALVQNVMNKICFNLD